MDRLAPPITQAPRGREIALAALGALLPRPDADAPPEARFLHQATAALADLQGAWQAALALPAPADTALVRAAGRLGLAPVEMLAVALAAAVEDDPVVGRVLAWLQAPGGGARPTLALLARAFAPLLDGGAGDADPAAREAGALYALACGNAVRRGLLLLDGEDRPLCERALRVAPCIAAALAGVESDGPGLAAPALWSPPEGLAALDEALALWAARLAATPRATLALRSASPAEAGGVAAALAARLGLRVAWFGAELPAGAEAWLAVSGRLPVFVLDAAPGELRTLPALAGHPTPMLAVLGPDGGLRRDDAAVADWRLPRPDAAERRVLWRAALGKVDAADTAALRYRAGYAQVAEHARLARLLAPPPIDPLHEAAVPSTGVIAQAAGMTSAGRALDALAEALPDALPEAALVVGESLRAELDRVLARCATRERLAGGLGAAARSRPCDGVRLLFTGGSGTGKSLAAQWLAARLGLPIYRVDLAAMLSKWIGDTEKHLAELLGRAEHADAVLLFDEADTLFGKRTEIATANDRFANAQTNYLLQRIESHRGIVVLTSNNRSRFDPAFVRRLDFIVDFGAPDAQARRALWSAHLGAQSVEPQALNRLAALADLAGGQIRNAVLAAAAQALARDAPLAPEDLADGVRAEYRKLGRTPPAGL
jgi:hypothetical protein